MPNLYHDLKLAARSLGRNPGFTAAAVLCLGLGLGATSTVFSVIDAVLLRDLQCADPDRVVGLWGQAGEEGQIPLSLTEVQAVEEGARSLARLAAAAPLNANLAAPDGDGEPLRLTGVRVTAGFFPLLGVPARHGRTLGEGDDRPGAPRVAVLSDSLWRDRFGSDAAVVGRKLVLDGEPYTVVGVMPEGFRFGGPATQLWVPLPADTTPPLVRSLYALGRLAPGVTVAAAQAEMEALGQSMRADNPQRYRAHWRLGLGLLRDQVVGRARQPLLVLAGAVALVLLIACVNVTCLLLARAAARRRELAIRTALGAGRAGLVRQVLAENLLLALGGWALGLLLAAWSVGTLVALGPEGIRRLENSHVGLATAGAGLLAALLAALVCGLPPLLGSWRPALQGTLKEGGKGSGLGRGGQRLLAALVAAEIAFAMVVLVGAGLLAQSFLRLRAIDPGYRTEGLLTAQLFLSPVSYPEPRLRAFCAALTDELARLPGASHAVLSGGIPLRNRMTMPVHLEGRLDEEMPVVDWQAVTPGYFATLGIPMRRGRDFAGADNGTAGEGVVIVDDLLARLLWPGEEAIGQRVRLGRDVESPFEWRRVVGVVAHVQVQSLDGDSAGQVYTPMLQLPPRLLSLVLRADSGDPLRLLPAAREAVARLDPGLALDKIQTLEEVAAASLAARTTVLVLLASFAAVALLLAVVGVYGVMAYSVAQRRRDLGLRLALGAEGRDVVRLVLGQGLALAAAGVTAGGLAALAGSRALAALLYGVEPTDPLTFAALALALLAIALLATWLPARRAARVDPVTALRAE